MDDERLSYELLELKRLILRRRHDADQVLDMKDSDDIIDRILVDGDPRELLFPCDTHYFVILCVDRERDDLLSVRHDLRDFLVVELENILDHLFLRILNVA